MRHLRWLSLLVLLGFVGLFTDDSTLQIMFTFLVFLPLWWYDELREAVFKQAATITFVTTTLSLSAALVYWSVMRDSAPGVLLDQFDLILTAVYSINIMVFALAFGRYLMHGFRQ
ncbi:MAG TPA: DUF3796 domain-containing protein [Armatimonadota bacterium]|nr:DUF3796 domain-containing protein [Armatimonadota bacterium]